MAGKEIIDIESSVACSKLEWIFDSVCNLIMQVKWNIACLCKT